MDFAHSISRQNMELKICTFTHTWREFLCHWRYYQCSVPSLCLELYFRSRNSKGIQILSSEWYVCLKQYLPTISLFGYAPQLSSLSILDLNRSLIRHLYGMKHLKSCVMSYVYLIVSLELYSSIQWLLVSTFVYVSIFDYHSEVHSILQISEETYFLLDPYYLALLSQFWHQEAHWNLAYCQQ